MTFFGILKFINLLLSGIWSFREFESSTISKFVFFLISGIWKFCNFKICFFFNFRNFHSSGIYCFGNYFSAFWHNRDLQNSTKLYHSQSSVKFTELFRRKYWTLRFFYEYSVFCPDKFRKFYRILFCNCLYPRFLNSSIKFIKLFF